MNLVPKRQTRPNGLWLDPFRELERLQNEMSSLFNLSWGDGTQKGGDLREFAWSPSVDYDETDDQVIVTTDLPGVDRKNIDVTLENGILTIRGERKEVRQESKKGLQRSERLVGQFYRQIALPTAVDENKVEADYKDGVLRLTLPKKEEAKPKQIKVAVD